jgi:murein DD-endopeptidase MepM/ murein hydrolase activator NlpD
VLTVKATALLALASTLAAVGIGAAMKGKAPRAAAPAIPSGSVASVASVVPVKKDPATAAKPATPPALLMPVQGYDVKNLRDNFDETRGGVRKHEALDIMAPRGTPVVAVDDGVVTKLFRSIAGGITIYQYDRSESFVYYYAHLDRYADGLREGQAIKRGEVIGYVGSTGNAPANAPHLHFTIFELGPEKKWWRGKAMNPFPYLAAR